MKKNTTQVLAELKKQQREPPFKAPQMDAPVQYTALAEIPATNPPCGCTQHKEIWPASTAPLSRLSLVSYKLLYSSYHTASSCAPRLRRPVRPRFRGRLRRLRRHERRRRFGFPRLLGAPPPPFLRGRGPEVLLRLWQPCYKPLKHSASLCKSSWQGTLCVRASSASACSSTTGCATNMQ
jgi:hypothetical protein